MSEEICLLVFGGRDYSRRERVFENILQMIDVPMEKVTIIHGACNFHPGAHPPYWPPTGADYWAHMFCERWWHCGIKERPRPAKWQDLGSPNAVVRRRADGTRYNVRAGFDRNQFMLDEDKPTHALGTPGGTGTADMHRRIVLANEQGAGIILRMIET